MNLSSADFKTSSNKLGKNTLEGIKKPIFTTPCSPFFQDLWDFSRNIVNKVEAKPLRVPFIRCGT